MLQSWLTYTREERQFTAYLFSDLLNNSAPFLTLLADAIPGFPKQTAAVDVAYEMAFFRDCCLCANRPKRCGSTAQKFDLAIRLSDESLVIVEAKAHGGHTNKQLNELAAALEQMRNRGCAAHFPCVYPLSLHSSAYSPSSSTLARFDGCYIHWSDIAAAYPRNAEVYTRADSVFRKGSGGG